MLRGASAGRHNLIRGDSARRVSHPPRLSSRFLQETESHRREKCSWIRAHFFVVVIDYSDPAWELTLLCGLGARLCGKQRRAPLLLGKTLQIALQTGRRTRRYVAELRRNERY